MGWLNHQPENQIDRPHSAPRWATSTMPRHQWVIASAQMSHRCWRFPWWNLPKKPDLFDFRCELAWIRGWFLWFLAGWCLESTIQMRRSSFKHGFPCPSVWLVKKIPMESGAASAASASTSLLRWSSEQLVNLWKKLIAQRRCQVYLHTCAMTYHRMDIIYSSVFSPALCISQDVCTVTVKNLSYVIFNCVWQRAYFTSSHIIVQQYSL